MDEAIDVTELQLDRGVDALLRYDIGEILDDLQAAIDLAPMVVGEFEDEQIFKDRMCHDRPRLCAFTLF